jgi:hypothetical protein
MATTTPTVTWRRGAGKKGTRKLGGRSASEADVWFLAAGARRSGSLEDELDRRARDLATIHRPERDAFGWQFKWGLVPWPASERSHCVFCGRLWLCPPAAWAHGRLSTLGSPGCELSEEGT